MRTRSVWLAAIVLGPCAVLSVLLLRYLEQERQLDERRAAEALERRVADARQRLLAEIEPVRLGAARAAFEGAVRQGRVVLPWEGRGDTAALARLERAVSSKDQAGLAELASLPASVTDEHGVPIAVYALPHGLEARRAALVRSIEARPELVSPRGLKMAGAPARLVQDAEAAARFQSSGVIAAAGQWIDWGEPPYLVGFTASGFRALRAPAGVSHTGGTPAGGTLSNVKLDLSPAAPAEPGNNRPTLITMFAIAIAVALTGGILLWRDERREREVAALRTQFIASVSHELRTPLTALRIFIESMKMNPALDEATRGEYLDTMLHETERLSRLVNNVLEFSRIEGRRKTYTLAPVELNEIVESVAASARPMLARAGFRMDVTVEDPHTNVEADRDALEQALLNLLTNAMKYSGASRQIQVSAGIEEGRAVIAVRDFGVGLAAAERDRIFESFYRVASPENRNIQGAGLGLTLVRHVMAGHRGEVTVESEPGKGSTFRLLLPV